MSSVPYRRAYNIHPPRFDTEKEAQRQAKVQTFIPPRVPLDIREQARLRALDGVVPRDVEADAARRNIVRPGGVEMIDWGQQLVANAWTLLIPRNLHRKRFVIVNPSGNPQTLFFAYSAGSQSPIPLFTGGVWDENGSEIAVGNIFVMCSAVVTVGAWEGVPVGYAQDEGLE